MYILPTSQSILVCSCVRQILSHPLIWRETERTLLRKDKGLGMNAERERDVF